MIVSIRSNLQAIAYGIYEKETQKHTHQLQIQMHKIKTHVYVISQ